MLSSSLESIDLITSSSNNRGNTAESSSTSDTNEYKRNRKYKKKNIKQIVAPIDDINYHSGDFTVCPTLFIELQKCVERINLDVCRCNDLYNDITNYNCIKSKKLSIEVLKTKLNTQKMKSVDNIETYVTIMGNMFNDIAENMFKRLCRIVTKIEHIHCKKIRPVYTLFKDLKYIETIIRLINERRKDDVLEDTSNISLFDGECCVDLEDDEKKCKMNLNNTCSDKNEAIVRHIISEEFYPNILDLSQRSDLSTDQRYIEDCMLEYSLYTIESENTKNRKSTISMKNNVPVTVLKNEVDSKLLNFVNDSTTYKKFTTKLCDTFSHPEKVNSELLNGLAKTLPCMFYQSECEVYNMMYFIEAAHVLKKYFQSYVIYKTFAHLLLDDNSDVADILPSTCLSKQIVDNNYDPKCLKNERFSMIHDIYYMLFQKFNISSV